MSNTITISRSSNTAYRQIKINSDWFVGSEYFSIEHGSNFMVITKHYIDLPDKAHKTIRGYFHLVSYAPLGKFDIDLEESTEDEIIIYFES